MPSRARFIDLLTALACVAVTLAFAWPMVRICHAEGDRSVCEWVANRGAGTDDWRYFAGVWEAARVALMDFHQLPSWNPYHCGGIVLYQDPQAPFPGPLFLLTYAWLPAVAAMKLWLLAHLLAGAFGARAIVRSMGGNAPEQVLAAVLVTACGFCGYHFGGGHLSFTPFLLFPWILWAHRRSLTDARWAVLVAALLALCVYEGATYPLPLMVVGLAVDTLLRLGDADDRRGLAAALPVVGVLFPLLAAARLLPVLHYLAEHPRLVPLDDQMTVAEVFQTWLSRDHEDAFGLHVYVWPEYGDYIGLVPVALLVAGIGSALGLRDGSARARRIDLALLGTMVWCVLGNLPGFSLFGLLHELPLYRSLRVPSRFLYPATVAAALLVARLLLDVRRRLGELGARRWLAGGFVATEILLTAGVAVDLCAANGPRLQPGADDVVPRASAAATFYQAADMDYAYWATNPVQGVGTPRCYVPLEWGPSPQLWEGPGAQFRVEPPGAGQARQTRWTPNAITFDVALARPAVLVVNQNQESGWRTTAGRIDPSRGLITVELPAGHHALTLRHRPRGLALGVACTLVGILLAAGVARRLTPAAVEALRAKARRLATER